MSAQAQSLTEVNSSSRHLYKTAVAFVIIDTLVFGLFMYCMYLRRKGNNIYTSLGVCVLMLVGYLSVLGNALVGILLVKIGGVGHHLDFWELTNPPTIEKFLQLQTGIEIIYMASITAPKIAILILYLQILVDRLARRLAWIMAMILVLFFLSGLVLALALCKPYEYKWNKSIPGECGDIMAGYRWISIPSVITDFFIIVIPIPTIWKLQVDRYKKIGLFVTFLTGSLGFITAIVRCITFYTSDLFADPTWLAGTTMVWTVIESSAYFICACLPRLRPLLQIILEKTRVIAIARSTWDSANKTRNSRAGIVEGTSNGMFSSNIGSNKGGFVQLDELKLHASNDERKISSGEDQSYQMEENSA